MAETYKKKQKNIQNNNKWKKIRKGSEKIKPSAEKRKN